uniref:Uncharacterized protein n=1 Tax=Opuntia streptacantha TaxID=393608 RepID=A0A7C9EJM9_OPUST
MGNPLAGLLPAPACFSAPSRSFRRRFGPPYWNATTPLNFRSTLGGRYVWGDASALFSRNKMCDKGEEERNFSKENVPYDPTRCTTRWKYVGTALFKSLSTNRKCW